ncbi:MAG TPA: SGNH/GDSL hydrolase family protein [Stellaceae bacterium]|nr:SGNH/GDSL hydrolase family protein [Stellaceae bacterium]
MRRSERQGRGAWAAVLLVAAAAWAAVMLGPAGRTASASGGRCGAPEDMVMLEHPLPHVAARLAAGGPLTIVALGSSSTYGTGATSQKHSYPSRLRAYLAEHYPAIEVRVLNRGVGGEEAEAMADRIDRDVLASHPDLVIWQVGTNAVLTNDDPAKFGEALGAGLRKIVDAHADVFLVNPQYAPAMLQHPRYRDMLHVLDAVAYEEDVAVFPRFAMMRHWADEGLMPLKLMLARDHLHMTDVSYDCLAREVAISIEAAAVPPKQDLVATTF